MSATNRGCERKTYDFYATPPETVRAFLANFDGISSGDRILEPSAGNGQIVKVLREGGYDNRIDAVELRPEERGTLEALADNVTIGSFFDYEPDCGYDVIIGNPPYSLALDFINKSLELLHPGGLLIFLLRTNFLESEKRFKWWQEHPLSGLYTLHKRPKIVKAVKGYGRYTDDSYAIARTREELLELLDGLEKEAKEYGLIINRKKTRVVKLSSEFRHLQVCYSLTETGRVIRKISPKNITRERRKLKAYKRLLDSGRIDYATVENAFKSWLGSHWKYMSHDQVYNMSSLYYELFGRRPKWKKGHGRLHWLMAHPSTASTSTGTTTSAPPSSPRPLSPVSSPA